ncbi:MAG: LAO/AO transport system kinase [Flavobacteriales bacterium]|jgi:LAO/AO transport system kinase
MSTDPNSSEEKAIQRIKAKRLANQDPALLFKQLVEGNRDALARGITWVESTLASDQLLAEELLKLILPYAGKSKRIGITGVPGVGKSTFIEQFGQLLISHGHKVAVLAIDPSSQRSHGSILGDKTRMDLLSRSELAFVRPSPASDTLGGVARATRESILLCEAAGFDIIIIETVGVGQSETSVHGMVDFFLLLMLAGAGDELQGIKRGIMEMADYILITKADAENQKPAIQAQRQYKAALHLFPPSEKAWYPAVELCSALENTGIDAFIERMNTYFESMKSAGWIAKNRTEQDVNWFYDALRYEVLQAFKRDPELHEKLKSLEKQVINKTISPFAAASSLANDKFE